MRSSRLARLIPTTSDVDGVVDAWWFCRRVWAFDYRRGRLEVDVDPLPAGVALGFPRGEDGQLLAPFPRVTAHIDGEDIDMLVDTGATVELTDSAQQQLRRPQFGASSFIVASVFDRWRRDHPTWPFLDHASTARSSPLIQVPTVLIGSTSMEACWFERRRDDDFHVYMSKWMDRTVHGALGATVYRGHRLVIDYVNDLLAIS